MFVYIHLFEFLIPKFYVQFFIIVSDGHYFDFVGFIFIFRFSSCSSQIDKFLCRSLSFSANITRSSANAHSEHFYWLQFIVSYLKTFQPLLRCFQHYYYKQKRAQNTSLFQSIFYFEHLRLRLLFGYNICSARIDFLLLFVTLIYFSLFHASPNFFL